MDNYIAIMTFAWYHYHTFATRKPSNLMFDELDKNDRTN